MPGDRHSIRRSAPYSAAGFIIQHRHALLRLRELMLRLIVGAMAGASLAICAMAATAPPTKCVVNGAVTYQQGPCATGEARKRPTVDELNAARNHQPVTPKTPAGQVPSAPSSPRGFQCDGRKYCSQMSSCEEAKYFLAHCPAVQMDGNHDGVPCERQWCSR